jgi:hypothetical protein
MLETILLDPVHHVNPVQSEVLRTLDEVGYDGFGSVKVYREPLEIGARTAIEYLKRL